MFKLAAALAATALTAEANVSWLYSHKPKQGYQKTRTISKKTNYSDYAPLPRGDYSKKSYRKRYEPKPKYEAPKYEEPQYEEPHYEEPDYGYDEYDTDNYYVDFARGYGGRQIDYDNLNNIGEGFTYKHRFAHGSGNHSPWHGEVHRHGAGIYNYWKRPEQQMRYH